MSSKVPLPDFLSWVAFFPSKSSLFPVRQLLLGIRSTKKHQLTENLLLLPTEYTENSPERLETTLRLPPAFLDLHPKIYFTILAFLRLWPALTFPVIFMREREKFPCWIWGGQSWFVISCCSQPNLKLVIEAWSCS